MDKSYIDYLDEDIFPFIYYNGYDCRYPTLSPLYFDESFYYEIKEVSQKLFSILLKSAKVFQNCPTKFIENMEMPKALIPYLNIKNEVGLPTFLSRFDFVLDKDYNLKMVEINADTPCAFIESYYANNVAANYFLAKDPNIYEYDKLASFLFDTVSRLVPPEININSAESTKKNILFSCFHDYKEDFGTTLFLMNALKKKAEEKGKLYNYNIFFKSFYDLLVEDGNIKVNDQYVDLIYRLHPMELLINEKTEDNEPLGEYFMDGYKSKKFRMINPPEAIILQNKRMQTLIYSLANVNNSPFTDEEINIVNQYMAASYFDDEYIRAVEHSNIDNKFIIKPIWGREGTGIEVVNKYSTIFKKEVDQYNIPQLESYKYLYQEYIEQPTFIVETDYAKDQEGYLTLSCFMLGDKPSAVYGRFNYEPIAATEAFWVPLLVKE